jgi:hypothetical protein
MLRLCGYQFNFTITELLIYTMIYRFYRKQRCISWGNPGDSKIPFPSCSLTRDCRCVDGGDMNYTPLSIAAVAAAAAAAVEAAARIVIINTSPLLPDGDDDDFSKMSS